MEVSTIITILSSLVALLAAIATAAGLFLKVDGAPFSFKTLRGETARIHGQGLYRYDTLFFGVGFKGQDAVALFLGLPSLILAVVLYRQGSLVGQLLLMGVLGYFLYLYASMALGAAYNRLFLLYIAIFSATLFAFIQLFASVGPWLQVMAMPAGLPHLSLAIFMMAAGSITLLVWAGPLVDAAIKGDPPDRMGSYTTMVTYALDLAIITPATFLGAALVFRGESLGYVIAVPLLTLIVFLAPQIILSTIFQKSAGVPFTRGEMIGPVSGFVILGGVAAWLLVVILSRFAEAV